MYPIKSTDDGIRNHKLLSLNQKGIPNIPVTSVFKNFP